MNWFSSVSNLKKKKKKSYTYDGLSRQRKIKEEKL